MNGNRGPVMKSLDQSSHLECRGKRLIDLELGPGILSPRAADDTGDGGRMRRERQ